MPEDITKLIKKLNSKLISNQYLTSVASGSNSLVEVAESTCGINSQNVSDSQMSFWARSDNFSQESLNSSFVPKGTISRTWTVRGTVHTFPTRDYNVHVFGSPVERHLSAYDSYAKQLGVPSREKRIRFLYEPLLDEMGQGTFSTDDVNKFISSRLEEIGIKGIRRMGRGWTKEKTLGPTWEGIREMSYMGLLTNAGRRGSGNIWMATRHWVGTNIRKPDLMESAKALVYSYIERYGPVTAQDIYYWTGHKKDVIRRILNEIGTDLVSEKIGGSGEIYYSTEHLENSYPEPPHALILPRFDSLMMSYYDKSRIMDPRFKKIVSAPAGIIMPTILIDGFVHGIWRKEIKGKNLRISVTKLKTFSSSGIKAVESKFREFADHEEMNLDLNFREAN